VAGTTGSRERPSNRTQTTNPHLQSENIETELSKLQELCLQCLQLFKRTRQTDILGQNRALAHPTQLLNLAGPSAQCDAYLEGVPSVDFDFPLHLRSQVSCITSCGDAKIVFPGRGVGFVNVQFLLDSAKINVYVVTHGVLCTETFTRPYFQQRPTYRNVSVFTLLSVEPS